MASEDTGVERTNDDATECKCSAVSLGYYEDKYVNKFWRRQVRRKPPILNRGYYIRARAVYETARWFVSHVAAQGHRPQVVNLGAGFDTLFWRLLDAGAVPTGGFFEVDTPAVAAKKRGVITRHPETLVTEGGGPDGTVAYHLLDGDLRNPAAVMAALAGAGFDGANPTLFVAECVLVYLDASATSSLLATLASAVTEACFINYEMVNPHDPFGKVMVRNLEARGCPLRGLDDCPSLEAQERRFEAAGWHSRPARDMNAVFGALPPAELARVRRLEIFDEIEEWELISAHYCVATAFKDGKGLGLDAIPV